MTAIPLSEQILAIQRELRLRYGSYPTMVRKGALTQAHMDYELACIQAVLETLQRLESQTELFTDIPREEPLMVGPLPPPHLDRQEVPHA